MQGGLARDVAKSSQAMASTVSNTCILSVLSDSSEIFGVVVSSLVYFYIKTSLYETVEMAIMVSVIIEIWHKWVKYIRKVAYKDTRLYPVA